MAAASSCPAGSAGKVDAGEGEVEAVDAAVGGRDADLATVALDDVPADRQAEAGAARAAFATAAVVALEDALAIGDQDRRARAIDRPSAAPSPGWRRCGSCRPCAGRSAVRLGEVREDRADQGLLSPTWGSSATCRSAPRALISGASRMMHSRSTALRSTARRCNGRSCERASCSSVSTSSRVRLAARRGRRDRAASRHGDPRRGAPTQLWHRRRPGRAAKATRAPPQPRMPRRPPSRLQAKRCGDAVADSRPQARPSFLCKRAGRSILAAIPVCCLAGRADAWGGSAIELRNATSCPEQRFRFASVCERVRCRATHIRVGRRAGAQVETPLSHGGSTPKGSALPRDRSGGWSPRPSPGGRHLRHEHHEAAAGGDPPCVDARRGAPLDRLRRHAVLVPDPSVAPTDKSGRQLETASIRR